jgi:hypothetical protein
VDAAEQELAPLRELAAELDRRAGSQEPDQGELERLRERALAVLRAFAALAGEPGDQAPAPPLPARRRDPGFWRR